MANDLGFTQASAILNGLMEQATGVKTIMPMNTYEFVTVGQLALKMGYDPILNAISQVQTRTIFSVRPYMAKFRSLEVSRQKFGAITRKLQIMDSDWENDQRQELIEDESVDMYKVRKPKILQTNFYGQNVFQRHYTIFKDQLDTAFTGPQQLSEFWTMVTQNIYDIIEQSREVMRRATLGNFIAGKYIGDTRNVYHLVTEYNGVTGQALTPMEVLQPKYFKPFMQWAFARIEQISSMMTERSVLFHVNIVGKNKMMRHTPKNRQKVFLYNPFKSMVESMVLADTYHDNFLKFADNEAINFWQNIETPTKMSIAPVYLGTDGKLLQGTATEIDNIFGVIADEEAMGITTVNEWSAPTPFNAAGGYSNIYFHYTMRYWNDFLENGAVLMLD